MAKKATTKRAAPADRPAFRWTKSKGNTTLEVWASSDGKVPRWVAVVEVEKDGTVVSYGDGAVGKICGAVAVG